MSQKNEISPLESSADVITAEAASWVAQIDSERMTDADRIALREWAARSPRHLAELKAMGALWCDIDSFLAPQQSAKSPASVLSVLWAAFRLKPLTAYGAVAATMAFVALAFWSAPLVQQYNGSQHQKLALSVPAGENQQYALSDGSKAHLNTDTFIEIDYSPKERSVRLIRGEAHFEVAKDKDRPFVVYAGGSKVRAVGTAFSVRLGQRDTSVVVTEGVVKFSAATHMTVSPEQTSAPLSGTDDVFVSAGQRVQLKQASETAELQVQNISGQALARTLSWREGLLVFEGEPLNSVLEEVARYTDVSIVISDPSLRALRIGGVFPTGEIESLLSALENSFNVHVQRFGDGVIYLSPKHAEEGQVQPAPKMVGA